MPDHASPYSEATVELVAAAIAAARNDDVFTEGEWNGSHWDSLRDAYRSDARAALDALADASLILPEGAETRGYEYASEHDHRQPVGFQRLETGVDRALSELRIARWTARDVPSRLVRRPVIVGPWSPVPPEPKDA